MINNALNHLKTHSERSVEDRSAVAILQNFFRVGGQINSNFSCNDKWPNIDGNFELVSNPEISRKPMQNFVVQIKGTDSNYEEDEDCLKYQLQSLAFPDYIKYEVTSDPGILFVVLNINDRTKERVFWKYISNSFLNSIDSTKDSCLIKFAPEDEIFNTDESINNFVEKLTKIAENYSFVKKLENIPYTFNNIIEIIKRCDEQITDAINQIDLFNETREVVSKKMQSCMSDLCESVLLCNAYNKGHENPSIRLAWEISLLDSKTKFLDIFLQSIKYIGRRIPEEGQNERLILSYYDFLWQIRRYLACNNKLYILSNLEKYPINKNKEDEDYYKMVGQVINELKDVNGFKKLRYYVEKKTPFFVGTERYFEITLQLAGKYASKFNRLTVYTKEDIITGYCIQIAYSEVEVPLWSKPTKIKIVTDWKVSIEPSVINLFSGILGEELKISSNYGEYTALMEFLTKTGMSLIDLIDMDLNNFNILVENIFKDKKTQHLKELLIKLQQEFSDKSTVAGRHVIRMLLLKLKEETIESVLPEFNDKGFYNKELRLTSRCSTFEGNPYLYNLPKQKTNKNVISKDVLRAVGMKQAHHNLPYIRLKNLTELTGEIYIEQEKIDEIIAIDTYNSKLTKFDREQGKEIKQYNEYVFIEEYERSTIYILQWLLERSKLGNIGQKKLNEKYIKDKEENLKDPLKKEALKKVFVDSKLLMIYGAAGTGKTTLMNYISQLMEGRSKLFLAKTHTAVDNLKRRIPFAGDNSRFVGIDSLLKKDENTDYDIVFIDECSTIDNRTMMRLLSKIREDSLIVMAGDIYQIESIDFGNWFAYAKNLIANNSKVELINNWRTELPNLQNLWDEVRNKGIHIVDMLVIDGPFSEEITEKLFEDRKKDEVVLCLNYDGRFGLNNINNYFQDANEHDENYWHDWKYKVGDPILFNESKRFPKLYNNLKGVIADIERNVDSITFTINVEADLTEIDTRGNDFIITDIQDDYTQIKFTVYENSGGTTEAEREESRMCSIVPFQIAYAVSIHKSQGLEYDTVKVVIPHINSESITHGIFYTAITRAKNKLKLYWSADTMNDVVNNIKTEKEHGHSYDILVTKLS